MSIEDYRHPFVFYGLSTTIPWTLWSIAAYLSHVTPANQGLVVAASLLGLIGLSAPALVALRMMSLDPGLRADIRHRLFSVGTIRLPYLLMTCFLMLGSILLAQAISLLFGHSADQFRFAGQASFSAGIFPAWVLLFLAPLLEELAWHSYGTDCLRRRMNLLNTSLLFAVFWALWHLPLSFIKGYYHSEVAASGLLYSLNFAFSIIPFVILMNWLYYRANRNLLVPIVFHITANLFNELFATAPDSKVIQTVILTLLVILLVVWDKDFFLQRTYREVSA